MMLRTRPPRDYVHRAWLYLEILEQRDTLSLSATCAARVTTDMEAFNFGGLDDIRAGATGRDVSFDANDTGGKSPSPDGRRDDLRIDRHSKLTHEPGFNIGIDDQSDGRLNPLSTGREPVGAPDSAAAEVAVATMSNFLETKVRTTSASGLPPR